MKGDINLLPEEIMSTTSYERPSSGLRCDKVGNRLNFSGCRYRMFNSGTGFTHKDAGKENLPSLKKR